VVVRIDEGGSVRAWTVRGGRYGEFERVALERGLVVLGWAELPDLSAATSIDEIAEVLRETYPDSVPRRIDNWAHQLGRFLKIMQVGDLVVMPQKYKPVIAVGSLTGDYEYRDDVPIGYRHVRQVKWLNTEVERAAVGGDLRDSMGSLLTVSELSQRDAVERVASLANTGTDPGYSGYVPPPADLDALRGEVDDAGTRQLTVRDLIGLWGCQRRTTDAIESVDQGLADLGLAVEPHFTTVQLGDLVTVSSIDTEESDASPTGPVDAPPGFDRITASDDGGAARDLAWRIGNLPLMRNVVTAESGQPLGRAIGLMVENEYSQLPVTEQHGRLAGIVTWESIAYAKFRGSPKTVADAMLSNPRTCREREELFPRISDIYKYGFLVIVDGDNVVTGILTAADLAAELRTRIQPFTVLEEIERRLRRAVATLSTNDLRACFRKGDPQAKRVNSARNLTLGNYSFLLDDPDRWAKLGWPYERPDIVEHLKKVANYRNEIAHWNVDAPGDDSDELAHAKQVLKLLKVLDRDPS
jgi:restriction system protein